MSSAAVPLRTGEKYFTHLYRLVWLCLTALLPALAVICALAQGARAEEAVTPDAVQSGSLLFGAAGRYVEAPRLATDVALDVGGPTARARVTQVFENPTDGFVEALYVFPLPDDSAVHALKMIVGDRVIVAEVKEKQAARAAYEQAKSEGRKAALVEQQRPNVFTNAVANIGPHEKVVVQIEYQQAVRLSGDRFSLRVPLVVAPRYAPEGTAPLTTPLAAPNEERVNPVTLSVDLKAGFALGAVESLYHKVRIDAPDAATRRIALDGPAAADRDFVLEWTAAQSEAPQVGLFREHVGDSDYVLASVTPPSPRPTQAPQPREIVFVIDNSGSMGGASIRQARASLDYALSRLAPSDRFNVIRFDDSMTKLFEDSVPATPRNVADARHYVENLDAAGGTEMLPPLNAALDDSHKGEGLRQVVFLTDGEISNEQQLLDTIAARRGRSRIFMVGIGSAPNTFLISRAAELGRGTFTHIGSVEEVEKQMRALFDKLENPAVTGLSLHFSQKDANVTPSLLPDLYRGEPLVIAARMKTATGIVTVDGTVDGRPWTVTLPLDRAAEAAGVSKIWARKKIDDAEAERTLGLITQEAADARILRLALEHHLVTRLTSLVAVDRTPSRPAGVPLTQADIPLQLPAGWSYEKLFGTRAARDVAPHAPTEDAVEIAPAPAMELPQTATPAELQMLAGLLAAALGLLALAAARRKEDAR